MPLAGGPLWFTEVAVYRRDAKPDLIPAKAVPDSALERLTAARTPIAGCRMDTVTLMGILNVTPDSFSDGGRFLNPEAAVAQAQQMVRDGAGIIDVGGESTRPGSTPVPVEEEIARVEVPITAISGLVDVPISIDTRKADVAEAALDAGAVLVNDVSGFTYDTALGPFCARRNVPVCVMHTQGDPQTMQDAPAYDDVRLDVFDFLSNRVDALVDMGISRDRIMVDPGIGFGKTMHHNLSLLNDISLFHGLGCPILLGASRKKFIGTISGAGNADTRMAGSVSVALNAASQGVQVIRVHDVKETRQALALWRAIEWGYEHGA
jgi:dihydropteroate synthase